MWYLNKEHSLYGNFKRKFRSSMMFSTSLELTLYKAVIVAGVLCPFGTDVHLLWLRLAVAHRDLTLSAKDESAISMKTSDHHRPVFVLHFINELMR